MMKICLSEIVQDCFQKNNDFFMKIKNFLFLLITSFIVVSDVQAKIYVLGYPKSGNNLLCYSLANILRKPVLLGQGVLFEPNPLGDVSAWIGKYKEKIKTEELIDVINFEHHPAGLSLHKANQINDYLIVIVRNYRECFIRGMLQERENGEALFEPQEVLTKVELLRSLDSIPDCYDTNAIDYINVLRCYDEWNPEKRILVYYEDLIEDFDLTMKNCLISMNVDIQCTSLDEFLMQKRERLAESRNNYRFGETVSENDINHHTKKWLSIDVIKQIDMEMKTNFPYFWDKYLSHYEFHEDEQV